MLGGTVECTATMKTPVQAGNALDVRFSFHNVSTKTASVDLQYGGMWILARSPDGTAYDSRVPFEEVRGPRLRPLSIAPGATATRRLTGVSVRWEGPLRITPGCGLTTLHSVRVAVASPGPPVSDAAAVNDVVAEGGHLLDRCRPRTPGVSVVGRLDPPSGNVPPIWARCSIGLRHENGFDVAQVLIVTPPDLRGVHVDQTYEALTGMRAENRNTEAIAWQLVVTRSGATSVISTEADTSRGAGGTPCRDYGTSPRPGRPTVMFSSVCR